jgi:hypothetical protein
LYAFHQEAKIKEAQQRRLPGEIAYIPEETPPLEGLGRVNRDLVQRCGERCPDQRIATVDQDTTLIESLQQQALLTDEGKRGYPPLRAVWAETGRGLADPFRDGNVARREPLAAGRRLAVIAHNVLAALKRRALPPELWTARRKRLRFLIFNTPGGLVPHARRLLRRLAALTEGITASREGLRLLPLPS